MKAVLDVGHALATMAGLVGTAIVASAVWWLDDAAGGPTARLAGALQ